MPSEAGDYGKLKKINEFFRSKTAREQPKPYLFKAT